MLSGNEILPGQGPCTQSTAEMDYENEHILLQQSIHHQPTTLSKHLTDM
jgi:hypothetical protein